MSLRNPIIISSSSLTNSAEKNKKLELAGAGAIVLKSVFEEQIMMEAHHMATYGSPEGDDYLSTYVRSHALNEYISLIEQTKKLCTIPVIASINCFSNSEWTDFARTVEAAGADALEINILSLQTEKEYQYGSFEQRHIDIVSSIKKQISIPVIVKLGSNLTNPIALINQLYANGANAVVLFNRFYQPDINIDTHDIFCRRCIQYSCRLVQRTALDCYRFGTSSSDRLCHFGRCARWKSDSQSNSGRRFRCRTVQCHLPKRQSGHCRYDK